MGEGPHVDRRRVPARCDGCGRTAADAGMAQHGWAVSPVTAAVPGTYCLQCASALRMLDWFVRCSECGAVVENEAAAEAIGWRFFADQLGQLQPCCAFCTAERRDV